MTVNKVIARKGCAALKLERWYKPDSALGRPGLAVCTVFNGGNYAGLIYATTANEAMLVFPALSISDRINVVVLPKDSITSMVGGDEND